MRKKIIITADDFGISHKVNKVIHKIAKKKDVQLISLLVNMNDSEEAVKMYRQGKWCPIGLHFNLVEGKPVTDPKLIPSLVNRSGQFYSLPKLIIRLALYLVQPKEVELELKNQLQMLKDWKLKCNHINSHQNIHLLPPIEGVVRKAARKNGIKRVRQNSSVRRRLKKFPYKLVAFEVVKLLLKWSYPEEKTWSENGFEDLGIHPGTNFD
jgi:predicted glycoside hydrolase/deacetylase ChbG (UPF0249 family)